MAFKKVKERDSFAQWFIDTFGEEKFETIINHEKNLNMGLNIWNISKRSTANIWFKCENKEYHEYCLSADSYYKGNRCKYCGRTKYVHPKDSLGQYIVDKHGKEFLNNIWSDKNKKSAFKYSTGSEQKVWLRCIEGMHEDCLRQVKNAIQYDFRCPMCSSAKTSSFLENKVFEYIKSMNYTTLNEHSCSIIPKNPKTKFPLPYDNEVKELKLIIEVHGKQHYELIGKSSKWLHGKNQEEYLNYRKLIDRYKRVFAIMQGFFYLEIPYWAEKNDLYKEIIDKKIKEITTHKNINIFTCND